MSVRHYEMTSLWCHCLIIPNIIPEPIVALCKNCYCTQLWIIWLKTTSYTTRILDITHTGTLWQQPWDTQTSSTFIHLLVPSPYSQCWKFVFLQSRIATVQKQHWMGERGKHWREVAEILQFNLFLTVFQGLLAMIVGFICNNQENVVSICVKVFLKIYKFLDTIFTRV